MCHCCSCDRIQRLAGCVGDEMHVEEAAHQDCWQLSEACDETVNNEQGLG
jgi:hypothetical protein